MTDEGFTRRQLLRGIPPTTLSGLTGCSQVVRERPPDRLAIASDRNTDDFATEPQFQPMYGVDPARTGHNTQGSVPRQSIQQKWSQKTGDRIRSAPAVVGETLFVGSADNHLYAIDTQTGTIRWAYETGHYVHSSPAVHGNTVYVGSFDHALYAFDATTGKRKWRFVTDDIVYSSPVVVDDTVYIGGNDEQLYAVDAQTGEQQWRFRTDGPIFASPAVINGSVYIPSYDRTLYALEMSDGTERWHASITDFVYAAPVVVGETIYVGRGEVSAFNVDTGTRKWRFTPPLSRFDIPRRGSGQAVMDGTVFAGRHDLYALDAATGEMIWEVAIDQNFTTLPLVVDDVVVLGTDGIVRVHDTETGKTLWQRDLGGQRPSPVAVGEKCVYVGVDDTVYALGPET